MGKTFFNPQIRLARLVFYTAWNCLCFRLVGAGDSMDLLNMRLKKILTVTGNHWKKSNNYHAAAVQDLSRSLHHFLLGLGQQASIHFNVKT